MCGRTAEHVGGLMKVEFDHDCSKMEESQMVVMAIELPTLWLLVYSC